MRYKRIAALSMALLMMMGSVTALAAAETATPAASKVYLTATMVTLDPASGQLPDYLTEIVAASYLINGNNYMKLRDIANAVMSFSVSWESGTNTITINSRASYKPDGSESTTAPAAQAQATPSTAKITLDGESITLTGYNIGGNNYYKLRDVGRALDFNVLWYGSHNAVVIQPQHEYVEEESMPPAEPTSADPVGYLHSYPSVQEVVDMYASQNRDNPAYWGGPTAMTTDTGYDLKWDCYVLSGSNVNADKVVQRTVPMKGDMSEVVQGFNDIYAVTHGQETAVTQDIIGGGAVTWADDEAVPLPEYDRSKYKVLPAISINAAAIDMLPSRRIFSSTERADGSWLERDSFVSFNVYEAQRVINTILKYAPNNPELWQDNDPSTGVPTFTITIHWDDTGISKNMSFPFRDWEIKGIVERENPLKNMRIFNSDSYIDGHFTQTTFYARF